jgi:hypothetical protein
MPLDNLQKLASSPYFDDYNEAKNFHRILFRPAVAVQVRELNQLQTIFQNQIERFASHIFKEGSIVSGCTITGYNNWKFIAVAPTQESTVTSVDLDSDLIGTRFRQTQVSNTGVIIHDAQGTIVQFKFGYAGNDDPSKLFYIKDSNDDVIPGLPIQVYSSTDRYIDEVEVRLAKQITGTNSNTTIQLLVGDRVDGALSGARGIVKSVVNTSTVLLERTYKDFVLNESIVKTTDSAANTTLSFVERKLGNLVGTIATYSTGTRPANTTFGVSGSAYGVGVAEGVVYQKGHFVRVEPQSVIVNENSADPSNKLVGFETIEEFITENVDASLYDNAAGTPNFNAPGAHRLKLSPTLVVRTRPLASGSTFLPIIEYGPEGAAFERTDPQYAALGDEIAKRTFEESGNYVIRPFNITSSTNQSSADLINYNIGSGIAYVKGRRVETKNALQIAGRKGVDTISYTSQPVSTTNGNYFRVTELFGDFDEDGSATVQLMGTPVLAASNTDPSFTRSTSAGGSVIGTANIRALELESGVAGQPNAVWRAYVFQVNMTGNNSVSSVRTVRRAAGAGGTAPFSYADVVLEDGIAVIKEQDKRPMLWEIGVDAVKSLRDASNNYATTYNYTHVGAATFSGTTEQAEFVRPDETFSFAFTTPDAESRVVVIAEADITTNNLAGTVTANATTTVVGTGTQFQNDYAPGDFIVVNGNRRQVASVANATQLTTTTAVPTAAANTHTRIFKNGQVINLATPTRSIAVSTNNFIVTLDSSNGYSTATAPVTFRFFATKGTSNIWANPLRKEVRRKVLVRFDTSAVGSAGPWNLGLPDVFRLRGVYNAARHANGSIVSNTSFNTAVNLLDDFVLNDGQTAQQYNHSSIALRPGVSTTKFANTWLLAEVDCFVANNASSGSGGFFSIESYPVDDSYGANTSSTISIYEVPTHFNTTFDKLYNLRNCIDFRPYKVATANVSTSIATSTANPASNNDFQASTANFNPHPSIGLFRTNFTHYLPRKDLIVVNPEGGFEVVEGIPSKNPKFPSIEDESLVIGRVSLPAYPTAPDDQLAYINATKTRAVIQLVTQRRFTMQDISAIEQRVTRLEYYTTLNALELSAKDLLITDAAGNDRFKNGFLVEPFNSHALGRVDSPEYRITIDEDEGVAIPFTAPTVFPIELDVSGSTGLRVTGDMVTLDYTDEAFITQPYASAFREPEPQITNPRQPVTYSGYLAVNPLFWTQENYNTPATSQTGSTDFEGPVVGLTRPSFTKTSAKIGVAKPKPLPSYAEDQIIPINVTTGPSVSGEPLVVNNNQLIGAKRLEFTASGMRPNTLHDLVIGGRYVVGQYTSDHAGNVQLTLIGGALTFEFPGNVFPVGSHAIELKSADGESYAATSVSVTYTAVNNPTVPVVKPRPVEYNPDWFTLRLSLNGTSEKVVKSTDPAASRQLSFTASLNTTDLDRIISLVGQSITSPTIRFSATGATVSPEVVSVVDLFAGTNVTLTPTDGGGVISASFTGTAVPLNVALSATAERPWLVTIETPQPQPGIGTPPRTSANVAIQTFNGGAPAFAASGVGYAALTGVASQDSANNSGSWSISAITTSGPAATFSSSNNTFQVSLANNSVAASVVQITATYTLGANSFSSQTVVTLSTTTAPREPTEPRWGIGGRRNPEYDGFFASF